MSLADGFVARRRERARLSPLLAALPAVAAILLWWLQDGLWQGVMLAGLAALMARDARAAGYPAIVCLSLAGLACGGIATLSVTGSGAVTLALALYLMASRAGALCAQPTPRHVIAISAALALAQFLDPAGAGVGALLLPALVSIAPRPGGPRRAGFAVLLMFVPVVSIIALAYLRSVVGFDPWAGLVHLSPPSVPHEPPLALTAIVAALAAAPLWLTGAVRELRSAPGRLALGAAAAFSVVLLAAALNGVTRDPAAVLAGILALSMAGVCAWPHARRHGDLALAALALSVVVALLSLSVLHFCFVGYV